MPKKNGFVLLFLVNVFFSANLLSIEVLNMALFQTKQLDPRSI